MMSVRQPSFSSSKLSTASIISQAEAKDELFDGKRTADLVLRVHQIQKQMLFFVFEPRYQLSSHFSAFSLALFANQILVLPAGRMA